VLIKYLIEHLNDRRHRNESSWQRFEPSS